MDCPSVVKGMRDILPPDTAIWRALESNLIQIAQQFAYEEIRTPILESLSLFHRAVGAGTDIVEKEMYAFSDQGKKMLCLRPEGTASTVRALLNQGALQQGEQRLWYLGPLFRRERPQKGRYRQFHQFGVEAFGFEGPGIEIEQILMVESFWQHLGLSEVIQLEINTLGNASARAAHREALIAYYQQHAEQLDEDSARRLDRNPLRILDSKNPAMQVLNAAAPKLLDFLEPTCQAHFDSVLAHLDHLDIQYKVNPCLVRGMDYYTRTVFEWTTDKLGAQSTVCAGGHYDGLVETWGGLATPACGFALGIERLLLLCETMEKETPEKTIDVYWITAGEAAQRYAWQQAKILRSIRPDLKVVVDCDPGKFKQQFKRADRAGAVWACIVGEDELAGNEITLKYLRESLPQKTMSWAALLKEINDYFGKMEVAEDIDVSNDSFKQHL